ncbi:MAG: acyl-CoA dehydrogenase [Gordonia sp.]|nr:acyl-CoA dehydrogenase [Gordonia sp. (in: high G+C Gram-positive bacteria)]
MDFELTDEQTMLRDVSRDMLAVNCAPELVRKIALEHTGVDKTLWQQGAALGWPGLAVPEELDGSAQGLVELCLVAEELGRAVAPGPFADTALVAAIAGRAGPDAQVISTRLASGSVSASVGLIGTVIATKSRGGYSLQGTLRFVQAAAGAEWILVLAHDGDTELAILVPSADTTVVRRSTIDQSRSWYDVHLTDVFAAETSVVATGLEVRHVIDSATVLIAADALGVGERLLEMTVDYAQSRQQFNRPIGSFQAVKHKIADMAASVLGVRAATYYAAMNLDERTPDASKYASVAKAFASEEISRVAGEALQIHGGIGFTWEHDLHLYLRRAKVDEIVFGDASVHNDRVLHLITG